METIKLTSMLSLAILISHVHSQGFYQPDPYGRHPMPAVAPMPMMHPMLPSLPVVNPYFYDSDIIDTRIDLATDIMSRDYAMGMMGSPFGVPAMPYPRPPPGQPIYRSAPRISYPQRTTRIIEAPTSIANSRFLDPAINSINVPISSFPGGPTSRSIAQRKGRRLSRKKRFLPIPFGPILPFGALAGLNPMFNPVIRGAAIAGHMLAHRNIMVAKHMALSARPRQRSRSVIRSRNQPNIVVVRSNASPYEQNGAGYSNLGAMNILNSQHAVNNLNPMGNNLNILNQGNNLNGLDGYSQGGFDVVNSLNGLGQSDNLNGFDILSQSSNLVDNGLNSLDLLNQGGNFIGLTESGNLGGMGAQVGNLGFAPDNSLNSLQSGNLASASIGSSGLSVTQNLGLGL